jgi:site-specific DNA recombinase
MADARGITTAEKAESESVDSSRRLSHGAKVKRGQLSAVQQGRYGTGPAPYGYRRGKENEKPLVVDDREAEVVRMVFREYLRHRSTGKVVAFLHARGIYTRKGNKWSRQAIAIILSNRTYRGRVTYGDVETQGLHDPIIEPALFYKANALKERKRRRKHSDMDDDLDGASDLSFEDGHHESEE